MPKDLHEGISDDGQSYTKIVEDDETNLIDENDILDEDDIGVDAVSSIMNKINVNNLPDDQRELFKQLKTELKSRGAESDSLKTQQGTVDVLKQIAEQLQSLKSADQTVDKDVGGKDKKSILDGIKFEDNDYYAPILVKLASAVEQALEKVEGLATERQRDKVQTFQEKAVTYIKEQKLSPKVVAKMDEIAKVMGAGAYNDLPRLSRLAKLELGIKEIPAEKPRINRGNIFEFGGKRRSDSNVDSKPAKTMQEAWDKAESMLAGQGED